MTGSDPLLDRLLTSLDVDVEAFAVCEIARGVRLTGCSAAIEVHYVLAGTAYFEIPGEPPIVCPTGGILMIPPGVCQAIAATPGPCRTMVDTDHCRVGADGLLRVDAAGGEAGDLRLICGLVRANLAGSFGLLDSIKRPIVAVLDDCPMIDTAYRTMLREIAAPELGARAVAGALMKACLILFLRDHFARAGYATPLLIALRDPRLGRAVSAVIDQPAARHSVAALASTAGMSRSAFAREFAQTFAISPMAFVAQTRLNHAAGLLKSTRLPIKVIAATIGFSSRSHFSRAFRDGYGLDPTAYRGVDMTEH